VNTAGEEWRTLRRFTIHALRVLGMGKAELENEVLTNKKTKTIIIIRLFLVSR
jgi:hypothetical protein